MNLSKTTIYNTRISLVKKLQDYDVKSSEDLSKIILDLINNHSPSEVIPSDFQWHFGDIKDTKDYLLCKLGKIRKTKEKTRFNEEKKIFIEIKSDDEDVFVSHVIFDKKNHFLLFEERPELGYKELMYVITESVKKIFDREINIEVLPNKLEVNRILKEAFRITKARFLLKPSNPDNSEDIKKMDDLIRDIRAKKAKMEFCNDDGLNFKESVTFNSALSLSNRGFGDFNLDYEFLDGKKRNFDSKRKQLKDNIPKPKSEVEWKTKLIELLTKTIDLLNKNE